MIWTSDLSSAVATAVAAKIAAAGTLLASVEYLARPDVLDDRSLMSWPVARLRAASLTIGPVARAIDTLLRRPQGFLLARSLVALLVLVGPVAWAIHPVPLLGLGLMAMIFLQRTPYGHDGADQMTMIVLLALGLGGLVPGVTGRQLALAFVGLQAALAYMTAGIAKATARGWWDGTFLTGITGMRMYGHSRLAASLSRRPAFARALAATTILWEVGFPTVLILPPTAAFAYLAVGVAFHVGNAVVMGLNTFFPAFLATYPALACWILRR